MTEKEKDHEILKKVIVEILTEHPEILKKAIWDYLGVRETDEKKMLENIEKNFRRIISEERSVLKKLAQ